MPTAVIACFCLRFVAVVLNKGDGECARKKGKRICFSFSFNRLCFSASLKRQRSQFLIYLFRVLTRGLIFNCTCSVFILSMGVKMKGICKGFNNFFSQMFVVKEREIEIGYPTDVKHVAHIGWDGATGNGNAPSWMNEFRTGPDFAASSIGNTGAALSPWSSQDFGEDMGERLASDTCKEIPSTDLPNIPKAKQKRKKARSNSSPRSTSSSTSKTARATKSKAKFIEGNSKSANIEVA